MTQQEIQDLIAENILSGGRRTFAEPMREVLNAINDAVFENNLSLTLYNPNPLQRVYQVGQTTVYNSKIYIAINETSGVFNIYDWEEISAGGGGVSVWGDLTGDITDQTDLINYIDSVFADAWSIEGNTLVARGKFGSVSGTSGFDFYRNNVVKGGLSDSDEWYFGTNAAFTDTYFSIQSDSSLGTINALGIKDSGNNFIFEFRSNANIKTPGIFLDSSEYNALSPYNRALYRENSGSKTVLDWVNTALNDWDGINTANWHFQYLCTGVNVDLHWGEHYLEGNWALSNGAGSYGGGVGVFYFKDAGTVPTSNPTGGGILYVESGALKFRGSAGTVSTVAPA